MEEHLSFVADGKKRLYLEHKSKIQDKIEAKYAEKMAQANWLIRIYYEMGIWWLTRQELKKLTSNHSLFLQYTSLPTLTH